MMRTRQGESQSECSAILIGAHLMQYFADAGGGERAELEGGRRREQSVYMCVVCVCVCMCVWCVYVCTVLYMYVCVCVWCVVCGVYVCGVYIQCCMCVCGVYVCVHVDVHTCM